MPLTHEQETALAKRTRRGDKAARDEFITANIPLVVHIARQHVGRGLELEDMIQEGTFGLMTAVDRFNYRKGHKFSTYATYWIRQAIGRAIENQSRLIRLPVHIIEQIAELVRAIKALEREFNRSPDLEEIADRTGFDADKIVSLLKASRSPLSLEGPASSSSMAGKASSDTGTGKKEKITPLFGVIESKESVFDKAANLELSEKINQALSKLTYREEQVIRRRYGIDNQSGAQSDPHQENILEAIGRDFNVSRERIRQIEAKALKKLSREKALMEFTSM